MSGDPGSQSLSMALLESVLSKSRLDAYRFDAGDTPRMVLGRYRWNLALSKALYSDLHLLEVAFRNRLHDGLTFHFHVEAWWDLPWSSLREREKVAAVRRRLRIGQAPMEPDRIVAALDFGFWTSLLSACYDQIIWNQRGLLQEAFPHMPRRWQNRLLLGKRMNPLRQLRNRVFHHDPIW